MNDALIESIRLELEAERINHRRENEYLTSEVDRLKAELEKAEHEFKNFHRLLCDRFMYEHDTVHWKMDQLSLIEHIDRIRPTPTEDKNG